jgi:uncharacterized membrane protein
MSHVWDENAGFDAAEPGHEEQRRARDRNVGTGERIASTVLGAGLALFGLRRRSLAGLVAAGAGALFLERGLTGHCRGYAALGVRSDDAHGTSHPLSRMIHTRRGITINRPVEEVYRAWRDLDDLARAIPRLVRVEKLAGDQSRWVAEGPRGRIVEWTARVTEDRPNERIAWETLDGSEVPSRGRVTFRPAPGGRGTEVRIQVTYGLPLGVIGAAAAKFSGSSPSDQLDSGLRRFRQFLETGEIADAGGPAGRRGPISSIFNRTGKAGPRTGEILGGTASAS